MKILTVGINHKTSSIDLREKFYLSPLERELLISDFKTDPSVVSAVILSTCNRCEIYATVVDDCQPKSLLDKLFRVKRQAMSLDLQQMFYFIEGAEAVKHFLQVACGLDSLILGEKQILGQIKEAVALSRQNGLMDKVLNILTNFVLETGKKARQDTQIDFGGVSVSAAAVNMANNILGGLEDKTVLVLGSGKMGQLALNNLQQKKVKQVFLMNRTTEKAVVVAEEFKAECVPFWNMKENLAKVDVCICSSGAPHYLISKDLVASIMATRFTPLVLVDISMPRNIDPAVAEVSNTRLIALDDLDKVIEGNLQKRKDAVILVNNLISRKVEEFYKAISKIEALSSEKILLSK
ncbi:MAG: glutamyl-tRNA reductase [Candidatus Omnitrophica bacterium]|nr:glutamyl-tRNA reductase [Candidatus Omnitrophota bacterium]